MTDEEYFAHMNRKIQAFREDRHIFEHGNLPDRQNNGVEGVEFTGVAIFAVGTVAFFILLLFLSGLR